MIMKVYTHSVIKSTINIGGISEKNITETAKERNEPIWQ